MNLSYRPIRRVSPLFADLNRILNSVDSAQPSQHWRPAAEITRTEAGYRVELDVPGVKADAIDISVEDKSLVISGERAAAAEADKVLRSERLTGRFKRSFSLSDDIDAESISARFADGVLVLELRLKEEVQPRKIEVSSAE